MGTSFSCTFKIRGTAYNFGPRLNEVQKFLFEGKAIGIAFDVIGKSQYTRAVRDAGLKRVIEVPVECKSGHGASYYVPSSYGRETKIVLKPGYDYYLKIENFAHLVLHEYTHALIRCDYLDPKEKAYLSRFSGGQSAGHCKDFKIALLVLDREFGLLSPSVYAELEALLYSKDWKRPYEFESRYLKPKLEYDEQRALTRELNLEKLTRASEAKTRSPKQRISAYLTQNWTLEGMAEKEINGYYSDLPVKSTWKASDVGEAIALFEQTSPVIVGPMDYRSSFVPWENRSEAARTNGGLAFAVYSVAELSTVEGAAALMVKPLIARVEAMQSMLEMCGLSDVLFAAGVRWSNDNGDALTAGRKDKSMEAAVLFKWDVCSTIYEGFSDGQIDFVALYTILYNKIRRVNLDYKKLTPHKYKMIEKLVRYFLEALPIPLVALSWRPFEDWDVYGDKVARRGILGRLREDKPLFWRGFIAGRLAEGAPIDIPGFFMQFSESDQGYCSAGDAIGSLSDVAVHPDGGFRRVYEAAVGEAHPRSGAIDSPIVAYAKGLTINQSSERRDMILEFLEDLSITLGTEGAFECVCLHYQSALYSELLCMFSAVQSFDMLQVEFLRRSRDSSADVSGLLGDYDIPYTPDEFDDYFAFLSLERGRSEIAVSVDIKNTEATLTIEEMAQVLGSGCPTVRIFRNTIGADCLLIFDGYRVYTSELTLREGGRDIYIQVLKQIRNKEPTDVFGSLDLRASARENFVRTQRAAIGLSVGDSEALLSMPVMSFKGSGDINLLGVENAGVYDIVLNLKAIPSVTLEEILPALEDSVLVAVQAPDGQQRYYYRHLGSAFEIDSVVAWWLLYL